MALRSLRRILPVADFGMASMNSTARTFFYGATRCPTYSMMSSAESSAPACGTT